MQKSLTYQTSYLNDSYSIFKDDKQVGKLYKKEWLGSPIESIINRHQFKFVSKGFLNRTITLFDKGSKQNIGTVTINNIFTISPSATLVLTGNRQYLWKTKGSFSYNWEWFDLSENKLVASSNEPLDLFQKKGTIYINEQNMQEELFVALGIHLRNSVQRQNLFIRMLGFITALFLLAKLFT